MPQAAIGRIVQYVLESGRSKGQARPAQIVAIFDQASGPPLLNLVVTLDGRNDALPQGDSHRHAVHTHAGDEAPPDLSGQAEGGFALHVWRTSIAHAEPFGADERVSPRLVPGTWHWPAGVA